MPQDLRDAQASQVPLGRFSEPFGSLLLSLPHFGARSSPFSLTEQAAQVLLFLSDYTSYQTGSEAFVDGVRFSSCDLPPLRRKLTLRPTSTGLPHLVIGFGKDTCLYRDHKSAVLDVDNTLILISKRRDGDF